MAGLAESDDLMGWSLTTGDYNNDGRADLCIGVPGQDVTPGGANCGGVITLKGSATGLVKSSSVFNTENSLGLVSNAAAVMGGGVYGP
jgi:hypothetical protein